MNYRFHFSPDEAALAQDMTISARVLDESPVRLWGLGSAERLRRQLREIGGIKWLDPADALPADGLVLLLSGRYLFEIRTLCGLLQNPGAVLFSNIADPTTAAAALVDARQAAAVAAFMSGQTDDLDGGLRRLDTAAIEAFDENLRSARQPLLELLGEDDRERLENLLYGNAYRGITDLVTKFVWPQPARRMVHLCARLGLSPNAVTSAGLLLVLAACWAFLHGDYAAGLAAGWIMTFLDTVDGKLARVTIQSSRFGHIFDHAIDLVHPPFWYLFWGMSLQGQLTESGFDLTVLGWILVAAYVLGRCVEGLFPLLGRCGMFTWRPFDAWFRLITARRNPCLILLTLGVVIGRPDWGFIAVVAWSALTTGVLVLRFVAGVLSRIRKGPLQSWLSEENVASGPHAASFRIFGGTRGAFSA